MCLSTLAIFTGTAHNCTTVCKTVHSSSLHWHCTQLYNCLYNCPLWLFSLTLYTTVQMYLKLFTLALFTGTAHNCMYNCTTVHSAYLHYHYTQLYNCPVWFSSIALHPTVQLYSVYLSILALFTSTAPYFTTVCTNVQLSVAL